MGNVRHRSIWLAATLCVALCGTLAVRMRHVSAAQAQMATPALVNSIPGLLPIYDLSGNTIANAKCFQGQVTSSATTGQWSVPNTPASLGVTSITSVSANVISPGGSLTSLSGQYGVSIQNATTSSVSGTVTSPATIVLGGISIGFGPAAATVYVRFCGSTS